MAQSFLLLGQRAEMPLAAPVAPGAADPGVEHAAAVELHATRAAGATRSASLGSRFVRRDLVRDLERHRHDRAGVVRQRRVGQQNRGARDPLSRADDLGRGLLPRKLAEELFDVLDLERALLELVLGDVIFHGSTAGSFALLLLRFFAHVSRSETVRLNTSAPGRESGIDAEIAEPLELKPRAGVAAAAEARFDLAAAAALRASAGFRLSRKVLPVLRRARDPRP